MPPVPRPRSPGSPFATLATLALPVLAGCVVERPDLVLAGGRVIDPQSGLDAVRWIAIDDGRVVDVSERPLGGVRVLDVTGLVVAPGFVDLNAPTGDVSGTAMLALAGVTSALNVEAGAYPVAEWYRVREGRSSVHFGASVSYAGARAEPFEVQAGVVVAARDRPLDGTAMEVLVRRVRAGLADGALGVGLVAGDVPGASAAELEDLFAVAGFDGVPVFARPPDGSAQALETLLAAAGLLGTSLHVVGLNSSTAEPLDLRLARLELARRGGLDVTGGIRLEGAGGAALAHRGVVLSGDSGSGAFLLALAPHLRGEPGLVDALARVTLLPARRLELVAPDFARKGRVQVGADADLVAIDPDELVVRHVVVGGVPVVRHGALVRGARPGRALRGVGWI